MRALRYYGAKDLRLEWDIPEPQCGPHQVKIKPAFVGICGSDLHEYLTHHFIPTTSNPHPITGESAPLTIGHEFSGVVVELGTNVSSITVGDKVVVLPTISCKTCDTCLAGYDNCCSKAGFIGVSGWGGGLSDFVCVNEDAVFVLPNHIPLDIGALVEPLSVSWHAVDTSRAGPDDEALVLGAGPIGIGVIQCLKAKGVKTIVVSEISSERRRLAKDLGATHVFNPASEDIIVKTREVCRGEGPRLAIDCAGVPTSIRTACVVVRPRGVVINVAVWPKDVLFQPNELIRGEKTYSAVLAYQRTDFVQVIEAIGSGKLKPSSMISKIIAIDRIVEDGFTMLLEQKDTHVKILIDMAKKTSLDHAN